MAYNGKKNPKFKGKPKFDAKNRKMDDSKIDKDKRFNCNDPQWYVKEGQIARDVASLSFNTALGSKVMVEPDNAGGSWNTVAVPYGVPGVLALNYIPSIGVSEGGYSPINIAAKNLYGKMRSANAGGKVYDSPDLILYVVAMDSIYMAIQHLQRAYGTARVYSQLNRYVGDGFLRAMGFDPDDVRANLAQFRAQINMLIVKASCFAVPNNMPLFQRHSWMARSIFQDAPVDKCQTYLYRPIAFYKYNETSGGPGECDITPAAVTILSGTSGEYVATTTWTVAQWINLVEDLLTAVVSSEDIATMSGDLIKWQGAENQLRLGMIPEDYVVEVNYSEEILDQIHNTVFCGAYPRTFIDVSDSDQVTKVNWATFNIVQDATIGDGALICKPKFMRCRHAGIKHILDMYDKEPTPERVLVATRNMVSGDVFTTPLNQFTLTSLVTCGSDICLFADLWDYRIDPNTNVWSMRKRYVASYDGTLDLDVSSDPGDYACFHRAPLLYTFNDVYDGAFSNTFGEIDNFTVIDRSTLSKMHESAIMSMLNVPV